MAVIIGAYTSVIALNKYSTTYIKVLDSDIVNRAVICVSSPEKMC